MKYPALGKWKNYCLVTQTELYFHRPIKRSYLTNLWFLTSFWRNQKHPIFLRIVICLQSKNRLKCFIKPIKLYFTSLTETLHTRKVCISRSPINAGLFRPTDKGHITNKICLILSIFIHQTRQTTKFSFLKKFKDSSVNYNHRKTVRWTLKMTLTL